MSHPAIATLLFVVVALLMIVVGGTLQGLHPQLGLIASEVVCILLPALGVLYWIRRRQASGPALAGGGTTRPPSELFGRVRALGLGPGWVVWLVSTAVLLGLAANAWTGVLAETGGMQDVAKTYEEMFRSLMYPADPMNRVLAICAIVVVAPISEEVLFRGVMLPLQRSSDRGLWLVIAVNGLLFSLLHMNPLSFAALVVVGMFFAHVAVISRSIWPPIIAHASLNFANGVVAPEVAEVAAPAAEASAGDYLTAGLVLTPIVAALWIWGAHRIAAENADA